LTLSEGSYELRFIPEALKEWQKLDNSVRAPLAKRLGKRLENPRVENERLSSDLNQCFKLKDNKTGYRLVYTLSEEEHILTVLAVGRRADKAVYKVTRIRS
jgi:mRNA interferase RelE/StbE